MKKELKDLSVEERKELFFLEALYLEIPYTIAIVPFLVIVVLTNNSWISFGSLVILLILIYGYFKERKSLRSVYEL